MNFLLIFLTGLTTGGLSCLALQGGLLASLVANQKEQEFAGAQGNKKAQRNLALQSCDTLDWLPVLMFLAGKLLIHTLFGFLLGLLGSVISLSLGVRLTFQLFTAIFMFGTAMNLLKVHPIFRYFAFQPPRFLQRLVHGSTKSQAIFAPLTLGLLTLFVPCGVTQAMEVLAIGSGQALTGALIMFFFVLGTFPLFAGIGLATAKLSEGWRHKFLKVASYALIVMALYTFNGVLTVWDSPFSLKNLTQAGAEIFTSQSTNPDTSLVETSSQGDQEITINVGNSGYTPNYFQIKAGVPVKLTLVSNNTYSCASAFVFRQFGISTYLKPTDNQTFTFMPM